MEFNVSVIIPVYNCESYIEKAIISALNQPEVLEIVVVNDGSTDNTEVILDRLVTENQKIKVFHHLNKANKGRSATRNLGIKQAKGNYIAFLDADDYYLPNRFANDKIILEINKKVDGVYNAIGVHFYREASNIEEERLKLTTVNAIINPENLFEDLLYYKKGHFSIDGLTVKKTIFNVVGDFDESLEVSEDTNLILRMALKCHLVSGIINEPVAMRGVHQTNIFNDVNLYEKVRPKVYESLLFWCTSKRISLKKIDTLLNFLWILRYKQEKALFKNTIYWSTLFFKSQRLMFSCLSIKYFPLVRLRKKLFPFLYK
jgi:glycosyltransferase involved in cell wall biosynthesis